MYKTVLIFLLLATFACKKDADPIFPEREGLFTPLQKKVAGAANRFGFDLFHAVNQTKKTQNIFISPLSVSMALGMTLNGADGETYDAMQSTLALTGLSQEEINQNYRGLINTLHTVDDQVTFEIANSIWYRNTMTFREDFLQRVEDYFYAMIQGLDFNDPASVAIINGWVKEKTHDKIETIIDYIDPLAVMFLINAIYFNGTWYYAFEEEETKAAEFTLEDGSEVTCDLMQQQADLAYFSNDLFQAVDLPYGEGAFRMAILLPQADNVFDDLMQQVTADNWSLWQTQFEQKNGVIYLPKFKLAFADTMNNELVDLGMGIAFGGEANFTRMYQPGGLYIGIVIHKSFVDVNEAGTEAAAVTAVGVLRGGSNEPSADFIMRMDHPFIFIIYEQQSNSILFMGKILKPVVDE
jgi:serine protease inhibitor